MYSAVIIDDEQWTFVDIKKTFPWEEHGFVVVGETTQAREGLALVEQLRPDILLTDVQMPGMNGIELIAQVRERGLDVEVVVISGFASFEYAQSMLNHGAFAYCLKPLQRAECAHVFEKLHSKLDTKYKSQDGSLLQRQVASIQNQRFQRLAQKMMVCYRQDLSLTQLAEEFGFNPNYCCTLFTKELNTTFSKYLTVVRLEAAKQLLRMGRGSLEEIAEQVGFQNSFYFSTVFKRNEGITPREYQRKMRRMTDEEAEPDTD